MEVLMFFADDKQRRYRMSRRDRAERMKYCTVSVLMMKYSDTSAAHKLLLQCTHVHIYLLLNVIIIRLSKRKGQHKRH